MEYWKEQGHDVLVAPLFLSEGYFTKHVIPGRLRGLEYAYSGRTLLPHPLLPHWIEQQVVTMLKKLQRVQ
ncbi:hypothetical protein D3C81_2323000 [compost metagenome]